jgi:hypothetical protein
MKQLFPILMFLLMPFCANSQIGIGTITPNTSSLLDVSSTDKGLLIPRLTTLQREAIISPTESLTVYDTDVNLYYYYSNSNASWTPINVCSIKTFSTGGTYNLQESDNGRIIDCTSTFNTTIRVPNSLPIGFQVSITHAGTGSVSFSGLGGMVVNNRYGATKSAGQWAKCGIEVKSSTSCVLSGDVK